MSQLFDAFTYVHDSRFVHLDVRPENILIALDENGAIKQVKLASFSTISSIIGNEVLYKTVGSINYIGNLSKFNVLLTFLKLLRS